MRLINSINLAGIASSTISNLEKMFGILGEVYLPKQYDGRTQHGDIEYQEEPFITKNFLFTNYIQNVVPSPGLKSFDIREEPLECYLPATDQISSIPKRSLVVLKTAHGEEKYVITQIEAMQGDLQTFIIKWGLIPSSISLDTPDELEENINIKEHPLRISKGCSLLSVEEIYRYSLTNGLIGLVHLSYLFLLKKLPIIELE
jgi:hypothetical protein